MTPALRELERLLASQGTTAEELVQLEHQRMATMNVTVRNVITSMRLITWFDWAEFVESVGLVDEVLRSRSRFAEMDFTTRNRVPERGRGARPAFAADRGRGRHVRGGPGGPGGERHAARRDRRRGASASQRSRVLPDLATAAPTSNAPSGRASRRVQRIERAMRRAGVALYVGLLALVSALVIGLWLLLSGDRGWALVVAILAIGPASSLAVTIVNHAVTRSIGPRPLPRLDLDDGVPTEMRTLVAVPMLLTSAADVDAQVATLEVHYLGNRDGDLRFALVSDWTRCRRRARRRRRRSARRGGFRYRSTQRTVRRCPGRRRPLPAPPPRQALERGREPLDGLGAQAGQARGAERVAPWIDDHELPDERRPALTVRRRECATS